MYSTTRNTPEFRDAPGIIGAVMKAQKIETEVSDVILVHYGEIALKGKNRPLFERAFRDNLERAGKHLGARTPRRGSGHFVVPIEAGADPRALAACLVRVPGVAWLAAARTCSHDPDAIGAQVLEMATRDGDGSFRIDARRSNKDYPLTSMDLNRQVGAQVVSATGRPVDLTTPKSTYGIEVGYRHTYIFSERLTGVGGLPVGVSGTLISLLSGGIDSPVAAWKMMKRGCRIAFVHFFNDTEGRGGVREKIEDLVRILSSTQGPSRLHVVPFGEVQRRIIQFVPAKYRMLVYRRLMFRLAEPIREKEGARGFVTGDSVGQVASQTLANMQVIYDASPVTVLSPLAGDNKEEIILTARKIGTYDTSILPYPDCCSYLISPHPATRASLEDVVALEGFEVEDVMRAALKETETLILGETPAFDTADLPSASRR
ncbi:MAG: tRNA 4-thiouridine(8) synthase ThiI [Planctomycetota bacterium]|nr:tRNA 4-thiouridine(8) synthase ThiI [Planctomycetota bacterium]